MVALKKRKRMTKGYLTAIGARKELLLLYRIYDFAHDAKQDKEQMPLR